MSEESEISIVEASFRKIVEVSENGDDAWIGQSYRATLGAANNALYIWHYNKDDHPELLATIDGRGDVGGFRPNEKGFTGDIAEVLAREAARHYIRVNKPDPNDPSLGL